MRSFRERCEEFAVVNGYVPVGYRTPRAGDDYVSMAAGVGFGGVIVRRVSPDVIDEPSQWRVIVRERTDFDRGGNKVRR